MSLMRWVILSLAVVLNSAWANQAVQVTQLDDGYLVSAPQLNLQRKIRAYGDDIIRIQSITTAQSFFADDHYLMVEQHNWPAELSFKQTKQQLIFATANIQVSLDPLTLQAQFQQINNIDNSSVFLQEITPLTQANQSISTQFKFDKNEKFTGLGHGFYARNSGLNLAGQIIERNYGSEPIEQAPLIVPFYLSSKNYAMFVNSMQQNRFNFGANQTYSIELNGYGSESQMDIFVIVGDDLKAVLNQYVKLTGKPRLPAKSMFGLQLSDKGHDHNSPTPSDQNWWQQQITQHRKAGLPLDHVVNDNRWRAAGGKRCESKLAWDKDRYPNPSEYKDWLEQNGLTLTLDFNRCIAQYSEGWQKSFNLPFIEEIEFRNSAPDLTNADFRQWFWQIFFTQALDPKLNYPGDALWIDEFDEQGAAPLTTKLANGHLSAEMRNYWFFLIAQALVKDGWDNANLNKRPFVWVRGMTAGAQRYATLWSGDIYPNYYDMQHSIRGMQLAGLSAFPYWGHDAGGFYDWQNNKGPDDVLYQQWALAMGAFSPIWKPHGMGESRWPLDRNQQVLAPFKHYAKLRYQLMPYLYSAAHQAHHTGVPIARAMLLEYPEYAQAWQYDLQYMWGDNLLVVPNSQPADKMGMSTVNFWLPPGLWYDINTDSSAAKTIEGDKVLQRKLLPAQMPIFAKAGSIVPKRPYAVSTLFIDKSQLILDVYTGEDGQFVLYEDDDKTPAYRLDNQYATSFILYQEALQRLTIHPSQGMYSNMPAQRHISVNFVGINQPPIEQIKLTVNGKAAPLKIEDNGVSFVAGVNEKAVLRW
ncbi:TIM-barrel domain-containing protein [Catenovulum sp. SX2]|uniref:glycoside hydrolase family 31 protein n=1 Tax=Catenovulum sp. SX2 TaxID=3398614 RepID=UPI003F875944